VQALLGATSRAPRWAAAYKFPATGARTTVLAVTMQVGRSGRATPVARLAPVVLHGATVTRATLHNHDNVLSRGSAGLSGPLAALCLGDAVVVERRGDVVPGIARRALAAEHNPDLPALVAGGALASDAVGTPVEDALPHRGCGAGREWLCACALRSTLRRKRNADHKGTYPVLTVLL
jgi:hypothetical protein